MIKSTRAISIAALAAFFAAACRSAAPRQDQPLSDGTRARTERGDGPDHNMDLYAYNKIIEKFERNKSLVNEDDIFITVASAYLLRYVDSPEKLRDVRDIELALEYSDKAIALNSSIAKYYGMRADTYEQLGKTKKDPAEREAYLSKALEDIGRCTVLAPSPDISEMCERSRIKVFNLLKNTQTPAASERPRRKP